MTVKVETINAEMDELKGFDRKEKHMIRFMIIDDQVHEITHPPMNGGKNDYDFPDFKNDMELIYDYLEKWLKK